MGEAKFTPGPYWRDRYSTNIEVPDADCHVGTIKASITPDIDAGLGSKPIGMHIALVFADGIIGAGLAEAHADLFAAAPEMYAALVEAADAIEGLIDGEKCEHAVNICWCGQRAVLKSCRAAIRKATGEGEVQGG